jgi:hypothetical protein
MSACAMLSYYRITRAASRERRKVEMLLSVAQWNDPVAAPWGFNGTTAGGRRTIEIL